MPRKAIELAPSQVAALKTPGLHAVGGVDGLCLQVSKDFVPEDRARGLPQRGGRSWVLRVLVGGRRRAIGLGAYPGVTLAMARADAAAKRRAIRDDSIDPVEQRRAAREARKVAQAVAAKTTILTFKAAAEDYVAAQEAGWKNPKLATNVRSLLKGDAYPVLGDLPCGEITTDHVLAVLRPIWRTKTVSAKRLRQRLESILDAAKARGAMPPGWENPARWRRHLDNLLAKPSKVAKPRKMAALPYALAPAFWAALAPAEGTGAEALRFTILTGARSGEVRGAVWSEIDLKARLWTLPEGRMKTSEEHIVHLSDAAVEILERLPRLPGSDLVFPSATGGQLSDQTLSACIKRMNARERTWIDKAGREVVVHGFRATLRTWAGDRGFAWEVAEAVLAHARGDETSQSYDRAEMLERRAELLDAWAAFVAARPKVRRPKAA